jgi:hypothetical protein
MNFINKIFKKMKKNFHWSSIAIFAAFKKLALSIVILLMVNNLAAQGPPTITMFAPLGGGTGSVITITGTNFTGATNVRFGGVPATSFTIVSPTMISAVVGSGGSGAVSVTTPAGNAARTWFSFQQRPTISSFTPVSGRPSTEVTIRGTNFSQINSVRFGNHEASFTIGLDLETIIAWVPFEAQSDRIYVSNFAGTAVSDSFMVIRNPEITGFTPSSGSTGTTVTISGAYFQGTTSVRIGGSAASSFTVVSPNMITAVVGVGGTGRIWVTTPAGSAQSREDFHFISAPQFSHFSPISGASGTTVTIVGTYFNNTTSVTFGGVPAASFTVLSPTTISAVVGSGTTGRIAVTTPLGTATSIQEFRHIPPPRILGFTPAIAGARTLITITGLNFNNATSVKFGDSAAVFAVQSSEIIRARLGFGESGHVSVTTPGGTDSLDGFTFVDAPKISSFYPGSATSGTTVKITGENLEHLTAVSFGGTPAISFRVISSTAIDAVVGKGSSGDVSVTTLGGTARREGFYFGPSTDVEATILQNPAQHQLQVNINSIKQERVTITLSRDNGLKSLIQTTTLVKGNNLININNYSNLRPGNYLLTISSGRGILQTLKVIKP